MVVIGWRSLKVGQRSYDDVYVISKIATHVDICFWRLYKFVKGMDKWLQMYYHYRSASILPLQKCECITITEVPVYYHYRNANILLLEKCGCITITEVWVY